MIEQAVEAFVQEAHDLLAELEAVFLEAEEDPSPARIDAIFRALHTIKGSGAMFGYTALSRFTHNFENAYEMVRAGSLAPDRNLIDLSLAARDMMATFLELGGDGYEAEALLGSAACRAMLDDLAALTGRATATKTAPESSAEPADSAHGKTRAWDIRFHPERQALRNGMRPDLLCEELLALGSGHVRFDVSAVPDLETLDPSDAVLGWRITLETDAPRSALDDVFIFADDASIQIDEIATQPPEAAEYGAMPEASPVKRESDQPAGRSQRDKAPENIRVSSARLDTMMDSLGELVIAQARLDALSESIGNPELEGLVEEVQRLVVGLRDATLSIRMLPIETVFGKFRRVVRDLSAEVGKEVRLVTEGGETEVDKNVIDRLNEPLVHMIRNSIDHGLETTEDRVRGGKPATGTVRLTARQEGGEILIVIEDNGRGLDAAAIRQRAVERGLLGEDENVSDTDLYHLIFEPGFSTAKSVSTLSGRGVGMDAVKTTIDALGGNVEISSFAGRGTRFILRLPVTLAIIDGLRVRVGQSTYVIPLSSVQECVELESEKGARGSGRSVLRIREELVPYLALDALFNVPGGNSDSRRVVIVRVDGERVGLVVDDILGQGQTVIKTLSSFHREIAGLGGATILGDGSVALIIDVATLVRSAHAANIPKQQMVA